MVRHEPNARIQLIDLSLTEAIPQLQKSKLEKLLSPRNIISLGLLFLIVFAIFVF